MNRDLSPITPHTEFDACTWLEHLRALSPPLFQNLKKIYPNAEAYDKTVLLKWLELTDKGAFVAMQGCENAWANAATAAFHQVVFLMNVFDHQPPVIENIPETPMPSPEVVERVEKEREDSMEEEGLPKPSYRMKGQWDDRFDPKNYGLYRSQESSEFLNQFARFRTYYDVNSVWELENLLDFFKEKEIDAHGIKDLHIAADLEMLRWKVVTEEPFEPEPTPRVRKRRKKIRT
jgi:hypothetical protein